MPIERTIPDSLRSIGALEIHIRAEVLDTDVWLSGLRRIVLASEDWEWWDRRCKSGGSKAYENRALCRYKRHREMRTDIQ